MARVPYVDPESFPGDRDLLETSMDDEDLPEEYRDLFSTGARRVHRTVANNPDLLRGFRESNATTWHESGLSDRERELTILASARANGSRYEWHQHVRHGLSVGLTPAEIRAVGRRDHEAFPEREAALLAYASATAEGTVDDDTFDRFAATFDRETVVGATMLVGSYTGLARSLDAMGVEPEEAFVGWELEGL
ncbi:MAG: carboxymuconolactone decarboxylase family protein [Haloarculaceae archaeon]|jgi:alkylhydroperoxidase family enzyme